MKLLRTLSVGLAVTFAASCSSNDDVGLSITGVAALEANCNLPEGDPDVFRSAGTFDPRAGVSFLLTPVVSNLLTPTGTDNQAVGDDDNFFPEANRVSLLGFDVCYARADNGELSNLGSNRSGFPLDCESDGLPGEFLGATASIDPGGGTFISSLAILGPPAQKALFGENFEPTELPAIGASMDGQTFFTAPVPATDTNRDPNWGDFPQADSVQVYVLVRAVGRSGGGRVVESEYIPFRVEVYPGFTSLFCGNLTAVTCPDTTAGFTGLVPDPATSCSVASVLDLSCIEFSTCN